MFGKKGVSPDIKSVKPTTNITGSVDKVKKAAAFKEDDFAGSIQDFNDFTDTNAKMPIGIDRLHFHNTVANENYINGHIKKLAYYPQRLTNEQLQNLTK